MDGEVPETGKRQLFFLLILEISVSATICINMDLVIHETTNSADL